MNDMDNIKKMKATSKVKDCEYITETFYRSKMVTRGGQYDMQMVIANMSNDEHIELCKKMDAEQKQVQPWPQGGHGQ
jgi:hypothetical protein